MQNVYRRGADGAQISACDAVGIQYQQGLKDMTPASDLVEGTVEQRRSSAGLRHRWHRAFRWQGDAPFQRGGRRRRSRCAGYQPGVDGPEFRSLYHPARYPLGRTLHRQWDRRFCVGLHDLRGGTCLAFCREDMQAPPANASGMFSSRSVVARSKGSASPVRSCGAGCLSRMAHFTRTWDGAQSLSCPPRKQNGAGSPRPRNGPSCMASYMVCRAIR